MGEPSLAVLSVPRQRVDAMGLAKWNEVPQSAETICSPTSGAPVLPQIFNEFTNSTVKQNETRGISLMRVLQEIKES